MATHPVHQYFKKLCTVRRYLHTITLSQFLRYKESPRKVLDSHIAYKKSKPVFFCSLIINKINPE